MDTPVPCRVLLVEDEADTSSILGRLLEIYGFEVQETADGSQGVQKALSWRPDAAVVDIDLPVLNGYEVARQIRAALGGGIRLIALSGYGRPVDKQKADEAGFDVYLTKPADPQELVRQLHPV